MLENDEMSFAVDIIALFCILNAFIQYLAGQVILFFL